MIKQGWKKTFAFTFSPSHRRWLVFALRVIGLIRVVISLGRADTLADDFLASDALLFLTSCLLSYAALRARSFRRRHLIERTADVVFITAMMVMTVICGFITYAMSVSPSTSH